MAIGDAYATAQLYRDVIDKTDTSEDAEILVDLQAVSRYLDRELGRHFTKDVGDIARDFRSSINTNILLIDDLSAAPTSVLVDDADSGTPALVYAVTDYQLQPVNAPTGPEPAPYTRIAVPSWSAQSHWIGNRTVRITGRWGWPAVPKAIERGTIHLTAILRLETPRAQATISELGQVVQSSPQARGIVNQLVQQYSRKPLLV